MERSRILVVDDEPAMLRSVERIFERDHDVLALASPAEALERAAEFNPDVAILDINMPVIDGFELMNRLMARDPRVRVILMTGSIYEIDQDLIRAIRERAFYYINKPFDREVLRTLIRRCLELMRLEDENRRYVNHLETELAAARAFQQAMLPPKSARLGDFHVRAEYRPCDELAGDLYDYASLGDGRVALLVADVSGHGASAAMLTSIVKSAFQSSDEDGYDPLAVVRRVAAGLTGFEAGRFVTLLCARVSRADGTLEYVNAGHDGGLVLDARGVLDIESTGPLIAQGLSGLGWTRREIEWTDDSLLLLYSDGVPEAEGHDHEMFGHERMLATLRRCERSPEAVTQALLRDVEAFRGGHKAEDDLTLLAVRSA